MPARSMEGPDPLPSLPCAGGGHAAWGARGVLGGPAAPQSSAAASSLTAELSVLILSMMISSACRTMDSALRTPVLSTRKMNSS